MPRKPRAVRGPRRSRREARRRLEKNKGAADKLRAGRGTVGKTPVEGMKDRATNQINARGAESTKKARASRVRVQPRRREAMVYTDETAAHRDIAREHEAVRRSIVEARSRHGAYQRDGVVPVDASAAPTEAESSVKPLARAAPVDAARRGCVALNTSAPFRSPKRRLILPGCLGFPQCQFISNAAPASRSERTKLTLTPSPRFLSSVRSEG